MIFTGKQRDLEAERRQRVEVGQLLHVAIADLAAGLVAFPDDARIAASRAKRSGREWLNGASQLQPSVPATRTPCLSRNSVASRPMPQPRVDEIGLAVRCAGRGVHQHDVERLAA